MATFVSGSNSAASVLPSRLGFFPIAPNRIMTNPVRMPTPMQPVRVPPSPINVFNVPTGASTGTPRSIGPAYSGPSGTDNQVPSQTSVGFAGTGGGGGMQGLDMGASPGAAMSGTTGFDFASIPWYVWAAVALAAFFILARPREVHIRA
jgi:hypothetical protein